MSLCERCEKRYYKYIFAITYGFIIYFFNSNWVNLVMFYYNIICEMQLFSSVRERLLYEGLVFLS